ncbi:porin family protein [Ferruginibacter albus]|uniref:porin family protein n=1 Tax=Ferruginibacter albus TaxID=2875540 RepID=UPI001CC488F6|nr:porin family protein [Ferruginibacter albus]UAY52641.1 porin family protein [Ferruginibacter albus]
MKQIYLIGMLLLFHFLGKSQDVIIKNDKSEIKCKVTEITDDVIKYKRWELKDGPIYNIKKQEVFMILYENGQREVIKATEQPTQTVSSPAPVTTPTNNSVGLYQSISSKNNRNSLLDTAINYQDIKVKYMPTRLQYGFSDPSSLSVEGEYRLAKNVMNIGGAYAVYFPDGYSMSMFSIYVAPYLAVNRMSGKYEQQDHGLFLSGRIGYGFFSISDNSGFSDNSSGLYYGAGLDYIFPSSTFGLSFSVYKYDQNDLISQAGICWSW